MVSKNKNRGNFKWQARLCWVGESQKACYESREEAEAAAVLARSEHQAPELMVYKCDFGNHWHLSSRN